MADLFNYFDEALRDTYALLVAGEAAGIAASMVVVQSQLVEIARIVAEREPSLAATLVSIADGLGCTARRARLLTGQPAEPGLETAAFIEQPARPQ